MFAINITMFRDLPSVIQTFGHRYAFHAFMNVITAAAAYVDFITGIYIWKKILISLKPSIRAASTISTGNAREFCLNIMIINGVEIIGRKKASTVFSKPALLNIRNRGIIVATCGIIIARSRTENSLSFHLS